MAAEVDEELAVRIGVARPVGGVHGQRRLADSRGSREHDRTRLGLRGAQPVEFGAAAGERGGVGGQFRGDRGGCLREGGGPYGGGEFVAEDRQVGLLQLGARADAEFLVEQRAGAVVPLQRLGLPARAVQGPHELGGEPLAHRVPRDVDGQFADGVLVPPQRELGLGPLLDGDQPLLHERGHDVALQHLGPDVGERRPAPQRERLAQQLRARGRLVGGHAAGPFGEGAKAQQIHVVRRGGQQITGRPVPNEPLVPQGPAQPPYVRPDRDGRSRAFAPQIPPQGVDGHRAPGVQEQPRQQHALLPRGHPYLPGAVRPHLDRPEHPKLHGRHPPALLITSRTHRDRA
ncbi:hypothetical protein OG946_20075 [Streptomyces sp. NBC_01808]|nr:hypothetical protein [Streptomyces sp. NBC_01808]WSA39453.1 hypothetical protein OG946_20075 [Streptomyces sp. NBC_01808]